MLLGNVIIGIDVEEYNPRLRTCAARVIAVGLCVCVRVSVRLSTVYLGNRGNSERETWTYYQVGGMHGKLRFWSREGRGSKRNGGLPR